MNCKIIKLTKYPSNKIVKLNFFPKSYIYYCEYKDKKMFDFDIINGITFTTLLNLNIKIMNDIVYIQTINDSLIDKDIKFKILLLG